MCTSFYKDLLDFLSNKKNLEKNNSVNKIPQELQATAEDYKKVGDELFYMRNEQQIPVLTVKAEQQRAIESAHCVKKDSHLGKYETYYKLGENFHWRGIRMDVEKYVSNCVTCSKSNSTSSQIWKQVQVEVIGPLPKGSCGEQYAVIAYDPFSQWIEAKAIDDNGASVIGQFLVECFARHSMAKCVFKDISKSSVSDIKDFVAKRWECFTECGYDAGNILKQWDIANVANTGDVDDILESRVPLLKKIKEWIWSCGDSWTTKLLPKVYSLRRCATEEDGVSPFQILYGRMPSDIVSKHENSDEVIKETTAVRKRISHACKVCNVVFSSQKALGIHMRKHKKEVEDEVKDGTEKEPEVPESPISVRNSGSNMYGLRTNLRASGKSAIVTRMLHRSRRKRSADMANDGVQHDIPDSVINSAKLPRISEDDGDDTYKMVVDVTETEIPKKPKRGRPRKKVPEAIKEDCADKVDAETASKGVKKGKDAIHMISVCRVCVPTFAAHTKDMELHNACHRDNSKLFFCSKCSHVTGIWARMREHLQREHEELFRSEEEDERGVDDKVHVDDNTPQEEISCQICPRTVFKSRMELELHTECHKDGSRLLHCQFCSLVGSRWEALKLHLEVAHEKTVPLEESFFGEKEADGRVASKVFKCEMCKMDIRGSSSLQRHVQMHRETVYECDDCDFATRVWTTYVDHRTSHLYVGYNCQVCKKHFAKRERLKVHMEVHQENRASAVCDKCGLTLLGVVALKRHMKNMHGDGSERYPCPLCPYVGKTRIYLRKHVSHLHNKPLNCELCDFGCHSQVVLAKHKDMFHNEEGRKFPCTECGYRGRDAKQLSEHVRFHHNPKSPRFKCDVCGTSFRSHTMLRDHLPIHSKQCDYECQICGYKTRYRRTMYRHAQNKHKGSPASAVFKGTSVPMKAVAKTPKRKPRAKKGAVLKSASEPQPENALLPDNVIVEMADNEEGKICSELGERNVVLTTCDGQLLSLEGLSGEHSIVLDASLLGNGNGTITLRENVHFQIVRTSSEDDRLQFEADPSRAATGILLAMDPDGNETGTITLVAASEEDTDLVIDGDCAEGDNGNDATV